MKIEMKNKKKKRHYLLSTWLYKPQSTKYNQPTPPRMYINDQVTCLKAINYMIMEQKYL